MEEANDSTGKNTIKQIKSVEISDLDDENSKECLLTCGTRLCLLGPASLDTEVVKAAEAFSVEVVISEDGSEWRDSSTVFVLADFEGPVYESLQKLKLRLLGTSALRELSARKEPLPPRSRPLYSLAMWGLIICFTGFRKKEELERLIKLIHNMGGHIRRDTGSEVTHVVAKRSGGKKYQYAMTFRVPVVSASWVYEAWAMRSQLDYSAADSSVIANHRLKPFQGARMCFVGFPEDEQKHMVEVLSQNGGTHTDHEDPECTHMVLDSAVTFDLIKAGVWVPQSLHSPPAPSLAPTPPSTSTPQVPLGTDTGKTEVDASPIRTQFITAMEISPDHPFQKELNQTINEMLKNSGEKIGRRLSLTPLLSPAVINSPLSNMKNKTNLSPIKEYSPLFIPQTKVCAKKELSFSENDECSSPRMDAKRRKTMSPTELQRFRKSKISPRNSFKKFTTSTLRKSFKLKTNSLARLISSNDVCMKSSPHLSAKYEEVAPCTPTPSQSTCDLTHLSPPPRPSLSSTTGQEDFHRMPMVVDESTISAVPTQAPQAYIVKAEWFWASVQNESCANEFDYLFEDYLEKALSPSVGNARNTPITPSTRARKRKRLQEVVGLIASGTVISPATSKRRSSVSDAGLLSVSGSFLDCTNSPATNIDGESSVSGSPLGVNLKDLSPRHQVFLELVQTEGNFVNILKTIMTLYKHPLENMVGKEDQLLNLTQINHIFGNLQPIYETHTKMLEDLTIVANNWTEDVGIGNIILKFADDVVKSYPPYVNFYESSIEMLNECDQTMPRFHAFLKIGQGKAESGRQSLGDLFVRPIQRLPQLIMLLTDILRRTPTNNADYSAVEAAANKLREVTTYINEDKRRTEGQMFLFEIFNDIEKCPPHIVSSHRNFITRCDIIELSDGLSRRGDQLAFFLFSDILEVCKKRSKAFNSLKSPNSSKLNSSAKQNTAPKINPAKVNTMRTNSGCKSYKHVQLMPLSNIKMVFDVTETEECHNIFALMCKSNQDLKEKVYSFSISDETDKTTFLKTLCRQVANTVCRPDAENFLDVLDAEQLNIDTSEIGMGTLSKAFKFASRTRIKVGRAFSFNKTPSKLKRAMSTMMSPFGSTSNLTPSSQLAQMRLASCNNLNELGAATPPAPQSYTAPMSVQPTRRNKHSSLSVASLRRL